MKKILFLLILLPFIGFGQLTDNPRYGRKSSAETELLSVELTSNYTVFYISTYSLTVDEHLKKYFEENPAIYKELSRKSRAYQAQWLKNKRQDILNTEYTIAIYSKSYVKDSKGRKYRFVKADGIPVEPDRMQTNEGRTYRFKAYYEKVEPGEEVIDFIEDLVENDGTLQYWNFYNIRINNPARPRSTPTPTPEPTPLPPVVEKKEDSSHYDGNVLQPDPVKKEALMYGRVYDNETKEPLAAKIVCNLIDFGVPYDSLTTSRSGYYEFLFKPASYNYVVSAPGYKTKTHSISEQELVNSNSFEKNIYLEPSDEEIVVVTPPVVKPEPVVEPEPEPIVEPEPVVVVPEPTVGDKVETVEENPTEAFRLSHVYFRKGKSKILSKSYDELDQLVYYLLNNPTVIIRIEGHTDNTGNADLNQQLSVERAYTVREYLVEKGVAGERLKFIGYGETRPVSPNDTEENKAINRRVEYVILEK